MCWNDFLKLINYLMDMCWNGQGTTVFMNWETWEME
jgi:hypothetical protein